MQNTIYSSRRRHFKIRFWHVYYGRPVSPVSGLAYRMYNITSKLSRLHGASPTTCNQGREILQGSTSLAIVTSSINY